MTTEPPPAADRHIWELQPVKDLFWIALGIACLGVAYMLRSATYPVLVALILAYWVAPSVSWFSAYLGVSRKVVAFLAFTVVMMVSTTFVIILVPAAIQQLRSLASEVPSQLERLLDRFEIGALLSEQLATPQDIGGSLRQLAGGAANLLGTITAAVGKGSSFLIQLIFGTALFLYFVITYPSLPDVSVYIPSGLRAQTLNLLGRFEEAFFGFLRGQFLVAMFTTTAFSIGFSLIGVRYGLVAALIGGVLSVIPYGQISGPIFAVLFGVLASLSSPNGDIAWVQVIVLPFLVYLVSQAMETFVITPLVQGSATKLHPLVIFGAVLCGGSVGGILGVFLAIPIAACGRILLVEVLLPGFLHLANRAGDSEPQEEGHPDGHGGARAAERERGSAQAG